MPQVRVAHPNITSDEAAKVPERTLIEPGDYAALIMSVNLGMTRTAKPLAKITVEMQILRSFDDSKATVFAGRRVYQDYILEPDESMEDLSKQRAHELRMLLDATGIPFNDEGFNTDHLIAKSVKITIKHRMGRPDPADLAKPVPVYMSVSKVDTLAHISSDQLL